MPPASQNASPLRSRAEVGQVLRSRGIAPTRQRLDIAHCLMAQHQHLSAEQLHERLTARLFNAPSRATIYNTLRLLAQRGLLREVVVDPQRVFFDSNTEPHHHYFDVDHGILTDIPLTSVQVANLPPLPSGLVQAEIDVVIRVRHG